MEQTVPQKAFGMSLDDLEVAWRAIEQKDPAARLVPAKLRMGVPLTAAETAALERNPELRTFSEAFGRVLNRVDEMGIAEGSRGATYFPFRRPGKVGGMLAGTAQRGVAGMEHWRHLDNPRLIEQLPADMSSAEAAVGYMRDAFDAAARKPLLKQLVALRESYAKTNPAMFNRLNNAIKFAKGGPGPEQMQLRDITLQPFRNHPVQVGETITSSGSLAPEGQYRVVRMVEGSQKDPRYVVQKDGVELPERYSQNDLNAIRFADTEIPTDWGQAIEQGTRRWMGRYFLWGNWWSGIKAAVSNAGRTGLAVELRDWGTAGKAATKFITGTASKADKAFWREVGAIDEGATAGDLMMEARSVADKVGMGFIVLPDMLSRVAIADATRARLARTMPELTKVQRNAKIRVELAAATDMASELSRAPEGNEGVIAALKFFKGSSIRTAEQAYDAVRTGNVPAIARGGVAAMLAGYSVLKTAGGTWDDAERLAVAITPMANELSGNGMSGGAFSMAAGEAKKAIEAAQYYGKSGQALPRSKMPMPPTVRRLADIAEGGAERALPVGGLPQLPSQAAASKVKSRYDRVERKKDRAEKASGRI